MRAHRGVGFFLLLLLSFCAQVAFAQMAVPATAKASAPAGFVAPSMPKASDTNAQRGLSEPPDREYPVGPPQGLSRSWERPGERLKSQPGNNAPLWRNVHESAATQGYASLPGVEQGVLIQGQTRYPGTQLTTAGEAWRQLRNQWIVPYGGALLVVIVLAIGLFYKARGAMTTHEPDTGRQLERFNPFERAVHWTVAGSFALLAVSGLTMMVGKFVLLPVIGGTLFGWLSYVLKNAHNFIGPLFCVSLILMIGLFAKDNLPRAVDWQWLARAGGLFSGQHVPSYRFNAGEKILFWLGVLLLGLLVCASGLVLDHLVPGIEHSRANMQLAHIAHALSTIAMMAMFLGHIYMGTIGVKGAYGAMRTGSVDVAWAKAHHELWCQEALVASQRGQSPTVQSGKNRPQEV
mgnify:CR=1 FL=1